MKTLIVYYSKTGNTRAVAERVREKLQCDIVELLYDEAAKKVSPMPDPAAYERVVLLAPVWGFEVAEPMKRYLSEKGKKIARYSLIVTCGGMGLRTCVRGCVKAIGKKPEAAQKIRSKVVKSGEYVITAV